MVRPILMEDAGTVRFIAFSDELQKIAMGKDASVLRTVRQFVNRPFAAGELKRAKNWGPEEFAKTYKKVQGQVGPEYAEKLKAKATKTPLLQKTEWGSGRSRQRVSEALEARRAAQAAGQAAA